MNRSADIHFFIDRFGAPRASMSRGRGDKTLAIVLTPEQHMEIKALISAIAIQSAPALQPVEVP